MRYIIHCFLLIAFVFVGSGKADAAFVVRQHTSVASIAVPEKRVVSIPDDRYTYHRSDWHGIAALIAGLLGTFIPHMYLLAILFGILGMSRRCKAHGLAVAGFIIGLAELALFLLTSSVVLSFIFF